MAVGAERKDVAVLVLSRAAILVLVGLCLGSVVAFTGARSLQASDWWRPLLFGVSWFEPQTYFAPRGAGLRISGGFFTPYVASHAR
jgi:ABC-type antimicrobial peptide transport system permease subunit